MSTAATRTNVNSVSVETVSFKPTKLAMIITTLPAAAAMPSVPQCCHQQVIVAPEPGVAAIATVSVIPAPIIFAIKVA